MLAKKNLLPMQCLSLLQPASFPPCYSACCAIHFDFFLWPLTWWLFLYEFIFLNLFSLLSHFCIPVSGTYIHFMLTCTTGFPSFLSPFLCSSCSSRPFCLSYFFLLYFVCHMHWGRLSRQSSDQPEIGVTYMAFLVLCLCKKIRLRRDGTRKSRRAVIHSDLIPVFCSTVTSFAPCASSSHAQMPNPQLPEKPHSSLPLPTLPGVLLRSKNLLRRVLFLDATHHILQARLISLSCLTSVSLWVIRI